MADQQGTGDGSPTNASKGGTARAERLSPEQRKAIAREAALARHGTAVERLPKAQYGSPDTPLIIGGIPIPCYVLDDGRRVIVQRGMLTALDMKQGTAGRGGGDRLVKFIRTKGVTDFVDEKIAGLITSPIIFRSPNGAIAYGYEATILADICDAVLQARKENSLHHQQAHIADKCEILVRAFAKTGIVALVDEATGYQDYRARDALAQILERYIADDLRKWVSTFPVDFYKELFRLRGWDYGNMKPNSPKPMLVGKITDDLVYKRIAPGVRDELRRVAERNEKGFLKNKLFQRLSTDVGHPKLREHLSAVVALMKVSPDWPTFTKNVNKALPRYDRTLELGLND